MSAESNPTLTYLLSSTPYTLAYCLPLLFLSFALTFSGTFLMLDRSRSFPPSADYSALPGAFKNKKRKFIWYLEGGVGGLACGYTAGLHFATFLSLLIPTKTTSAPLSSKSFLAVWLIVCIFTTLLSGRYQYVALGMAGFSGGALASLALLVILHPSLPPRIILTSILAPLFTCLILVFYFVPKFHSWLLHPTLRFCTSSNGAFGIVLSISLLCNPRVDAWANVWDRLWLHDGDGWGTGKEKGLSAAFCIFLAVGAAVDLALHRWLGECPDEKWDNYLANYMTNLPNQADRAGIFEPPKPFWDRFFSSNEKRGPIPFSSDSDPDGRPQSPLKFTDQSPSFPVLPPNGLLKKPKTITHRFQRSATRKRKPVKFGGLDELSSSDEEDYSMRGSPVMLAPLSYASSTPTLVDEPPKALRKKTIMAAEDPEKSLSIDYDAELAELKKTKGNTNVDGMPDYSDPEEEDLMSVSQLRQSNGHGRWSPAFLKQQHSFGLGYSAEHGSVAGGSPVIPFPGSVPVPATPSLIKALDRIAVAKRDAFGHSSTSSTSTSKPNMGGDAQRGSMKAINSVRGNNVIEEDEEDNVRIAEQARAERAPRWEEFWREVRDKARSK